MYNIEVRDSEIEGEGIFATRDFAVGEKIYKYQPGRRVKRSDAHTLTQEEQEHLDVFGPDYYELMTPPASYVNHSCDSNMIEKERVGYALKSIKKEEELTTDYRPFLRRLADEMSLWLKKLYWHRHWQFFLDAA